MIARGLIPDRMEDKWFVYHENATVFFHRSWTGYCIFQVGLVRQNDTYVVSDVLVNRDETQYSGSNAAYDQQLLLFLINHLLLGQRQPLPVPAGVPTDIATALYHHHVAGAGHKKPHVATVTLGGMARWLRDWVWWLIKR